MKRLPAVISFTIVAVSTALSQSAKPVAGFDVASIKLSNPSAVGTEFGMSPSGSFFAKGVTVSTLIQSSYDVRKFQLSGGPGWIETERYDIVTQLDGSIPEGDPRRATTNGREVIWNGLLAKVQVLLADRFQLKVHRETKELSVYSLVVASAGSRLRAPKEGETSSLNIQRIETGSTVISGTRLPLSSLVRYLSGQVDRVMVDRTGLEADYDFVLTFASDIARPAEFGAAGVGLSGSPLGEGPSVFTALQEQLGLRLATEKQPVEILVIDSVQKPSEN